MKPRTALYLALALFSATTASGACCSRPSSPEAALEQFYTYGNNPNEFVAEDMTMDPLILAGDDVVPLVTERIKDPSMPRRFVAMYFLGNGRYRSALPTLDAILESSSEEARIRTIALESIYLIDEQLGRERASAFADDPQIGTRAGDILSGKFVWERRTDADACSGRHE